VLRFIITGGVALVVVFSAIAILVIFNTITLTIYNRREEVEIMRLVGATNWYIRGPFIVEALLYSIVGTILTSALLAALLSRMAPLLSLLVGASLSEGERGSVSLFQTASLFSLPFLTGAMLVVAVLLSVVSSLLAIRKYLRV
jgi:cell division transport system permease protein